MLRKLLSMPLPFRNAQNASLSLVDYLPTDLESLSYVPHGMQGTVTNLINQRLKAEAQGRI